MEVVRLERFALEGPLGSGSDYEAYAAVDTETGAPVVIKRPNPDYIARKLHSGVDALSERLIELHTSVGNSQPNVAALVGYTEVAMHDAHFGDALGEPYRALILERARGFPLVADIQDKFKGVPIGLGQGLFALHPLVPHPQGGAFIVHQQLMDVEEAFQDAGHLLLDMRPQNVFFDPAGGSIKVIDIGTVPTHGRVTQGRASLGAGPRDINDFLLELFKWYVPVDGPPADPAGYREPAGMRSVPDFGQQVDSLTGAHARAPAGSARDMALAILGRLRERAYGSVREFRRDFDPYLAQVEERNRNLPDRPARLGAWRQAMGLLSDAYWRKFLFNPDTDLVRYR